MQIRFFEFPTIFLDWHNKTKLVPISGFKWKKSSQYYCINRYHLYFSIKKHNLSIQKLKYFIYIALVKH